ncbi:MAG TPA: helix-turn-helix transcriptional regulator [Xanthobacteraceae bacterium]|jgi:transcriptional regulator with XRE-family HTH domain|nr:helix-turn-helix transcriptional regulator [Xanthobacteraceae bacterium]
MSRKLHVGSTLEGLLEQDGTREEVYADAVKRVVALQLRQAMEQGGMTVSEMARRMTTSRSQVERVISPESESVTVATLAKAAHAVGYKLDIKLVPTRTLSSKRGKQRATAISAKHKSAVEKRRKSA